MHILLLAAVCLAATPASPKIAVSTLGNVNASPALVSFASEHLAEELRGLGLRVTTAGDMAAVLGLEREKQLLGCADSSSSCLAELASALGVDVIVSGQIAKFGSTYQVDLKLLSARDGSRLGGWNARLRDEGELPEVLKRAANAFAQQLGPSGPLVPTTPPPRNASVEPVHESPPMSHALRPTAWIPAVAGGAFLVGGVVAFVVGHNQYLELRDGQTLSAKAWTRDQTQGPVLEGLGVLGVLAGLAGLGTAGVFFLLPTGPTPVTLSVGPNTLSVGGTW